VKALNRIESVDVARSLAITAVIALHTEPFSGSSSLDADVSKYLSVIIDQLARFAVPFFFVISGFFWGTKVKNSDSIASVSIPMAKRILFLFASWSIVYALPYNLSAMAEYGLLGPIKLVYWLLIDLTKHPGTLVMQGTKVHLWFLIALLCSLGISSLLVGGKHYKTLVALSVTLYVIGVLAKAYSHTPFGIHTDFNTRNGPFFGTVFFVSGYFLSSLTPNPGWFSKGIALLGVGWFLHFSEVYLLWSLYGIRPYQQDYVLSTYFMGVGAAVASLSNTALLRNIVLIEVGKFAAGIYLIHYIFVDILRPVGKFTSSSLWEIGYILFVLLFSVASVMVLSQNKITRRFVV
jgi:surface polysaccharide O-acyltransferase-like enzyme